MYAKKPGLNEYNPGFAFAFQFTVGHRIRGSRHTVN